ncbi:Bug family tripartite tricarboxylate transporter substrate binding protein [Bordetella genomosp. 12]|uniref:ABC transporter substrate-binding protein n=1 Tax=Bordetella genomosp. 12 TaxID=463035 RepID=A0A261V9J1_9BORD|nr:tripartite tricarboxylate transporter substrate binding protein [Bordetella genomosp. 12]OZI70828.1 ABC transporter substrate-binding protein [Bordetella genomosp. 12]
MFHTIKHLALACALLTHAAAWAAYPDKPVTIIVPFPGGQTGDIIARTVGEQLTRKFGQPFIIENKAGAGGTLGTAYAARAQHDGYTLLLTSTGPFAIAPSLYSRLAYKPLEDFVAVADIAATPQILAVGANSGIQSVAQLIDAARKGDLSYASAGNGSTQHLTMEVFKDETGIKMVHIPFKGSAEAQTQVIGGLIPATSDSLPAILPQIKAKKLRALAVLDQERSPFLPDLPTLHEQGYPAFSTVAFFGLLAPKGTDPRIIDALNTELNDILRNPEVAQRFQTLALTPAKPKTARQFQDYLGEEVSKWQRIVGDAGVKLD